MSEASATASARSGVKDRRASFFSVFSFWYCIYPYGSTDMEQGRRTLARRLLPTLCVGQRTPLKVPE